MYIFRITVLGTQLQNDGQCPGHPVHAMVTVYFDNIDDVTKSTEGYFYYLLRYQNDLYFTYCE